MGVRLVSSGGNVSNPAFIHAYASGVINMNGLVDWDRSGTGGSLVSPSTSSSTTTMIFGVAQSGAIGASDSLVRVIPFAEGQLWEVDCANAATTAQIGLRHGLSATRNYVHNTATDIGAAAAKATRVTGVFLALAMTGSTSGSGKLIGKFVYQHDPILVDTQT